MERGIRKVMVLSSDKGCHPSNFYGNSKAMAEALAVHWNTYGYPRGGRSAAVRYGNVLGSRGPPGGPPSAGDRPAHDALLDHSEPSRPVCGGLPCPHGGRGDLRPEAPVH